MSVIRGAFLVFFNIFFSSEGSKKRNLATKLTTLDKQAKTKHTLLWACSYSTFFARKPSQSISITAVLAGHMSRPRLCTVFSSVSPKSKGELGGGGARRGTSSLCSCRNIPPILPRAFAGPSLQHAKILILYGFLYIRFSLSLFWFYLHLSFLFFFLRYFFPSFPILHHNFFHDFLLSQTIYLFFRLHLSLFISLFVHYFLISHKLFLSPLHFIIYFCIQCKEKYSSFWKNYRP